MSRPRSSDAPVTLLPFLAVLVCTMGSLVVLLVIVMQQARVAGTAPQTVQVDNGPAPAAAAPLTAEPTSPPTVGDELESSDETPFAMLPPLLENPVDSAPPVEIPTGPTAEDVQQAQQARDKHLWEIQLLAEAQKKTQQRLSEKNLELSHLEEHTRRLIAELKQLQETANQKAANFAASSEPSPNRDLADLDTQIAAKQAELDALRSAAAQRKPSYQLVPYNGSRGTTRRPIYVECLANAVVIQPEGIQLTAEDFALPKNAGNPLAASLRAIREFWATTELAAERGEPYPLLIVRPGGEGTYNVCRLAMKSWDNEFGYELVPNDVELAYPEKDAALADTIQQALVTARQQQRHMLSLIAASRPDNSPTYRASRTAGGFVRDGGGTGKPGARNAFGANSRSSNGATSPSPTAGNANGTQPSNMDSEDSNILLAHGRPGGLAGLDSASIDNRDSAFQPAPPFVNSTTNSSDTNERRIDAPAFELPSDPVAGAAAKGSSRFEIGDSLVNAPQGPGSLAADDLTGKSVSQEEGDSALQRGGGSLGDNASQNDGVAQESRASQQQASREFPSPPEVSSEIAKMPPFGPDVDRSAPYQSGPQNPGPPPLGGASPSASATMPLAAPQPPTPMLSLANTRGRDWALPNAVQGAIPIERPLYIAVNRAQMVLEAEPGTSQIPIVVTFGKGTPQAVQSLVTNIWKRIEGWGVAGPGVYWRPKLRMDVSSDGAEVYAELEALLQDSGLQIERN